MNAVGRSILRSVVIGAGAVLTLFSVLTFRPADWPIYAVFVLVNLLLFPFLVELVPGLILGIPQLGAIIGFLYIGGLPIIALITVTPSVARLLYTGLPAGLKARVP